MKKVAPKKGLAGLHPKWKIVYPKVFHDEDMLIAARRQLIQCGGRPMLMGRSGAAYEALMTLTEMASAIPRRHGLLNRLKPGRFAEYRGGPA